MQDSLRNQGDPGKAAASLRTPGHTANKHRNPEHQSTVSFLWLPTPGSRARVRLSPSPSRKRRLGRKGFSAWCHLSLTRGWAMASAAEPELQRVKGSSRGLFAPLQHGSAGAGGAGQHRGTAFWINLLTSFPGKHFCPALGVTTAVTSFKMIFFSKSQHNQSWLPASAPPFGFSALT